MLLLIIGGPTLFVLGRVLFTMRVSDAVPWRRVAWLLPPLLILPWAGGWPPGLVTATMALGLAGHVFVPGGDRETRPGVEAEQPEN